ncbi:biotin carboxylase [Streptacidiphilus sp. MAP12-33]|uniref:ATP-grasp domain-containing protein n=1 Tax=Streptacidiphilus sp. MAP12-33 TaxID=3156266 RepID=UPI003515570E
MTPTRLLVLGAGEGHQTAFATWIRAGLRITLVDGFSKPRYEFLCDEFHPLDVRRADPHHPRHDPGLTDHLVRLAEEHDGVVTLTEECAGVTPLIAERAGLPGAGPDAARIARDKHLQRASLERAGLRVPRYAELRSPEAFLRFLAAAEGPVVIKPVDSGGSASVRLIRRAEEATAAFERAIAYSGSGRCIAEEYIEGPEISVEAAVQGGLVKRVAVTRKELAGPEFFLERGHLVSPADELDGRSTRAVQQLVDAHGIQDAFLHAEYRISGGELVNIEFAARPGGGHIMDLVLRSRGWNPYAAQARLALGLPVDDGEGAADPLQERHAAVHFLIAGGFVHGYAEQAPLLAGLPQVETVSQSVREGRTLPFPEAGWHRAGMALGTGPEPGELRNQLRTAVQRLARAMGVTEIGDRRVSEFPTGTAHPVGLPAGKGPSR